MSVDVKSEKLGRLVDENVEVEQLATGFTFTEGPIWNPQGQFLLFSDMPGDTRRRWDEQGGVQVVASPSNKGNGMTLDASGRLLVCEHSTSSLVRMNPDGTGSGREVLASHYEGQELNSPNDVCIDSDGSIWFSDPWYGRMPVFGVERERELGWQGVFRIPPGGGDPQLVVGKDEYEQPNGLCFSPDESLLYINDTPRALIKVYDVGADGSLSNGRLFFEGIGSGVIEEGIPDGMKCDEQGNIWVTGPGGVWVISPDGRAPRDDQGAGEHRQPGLGRPGLELAVHPELDLALPREDQGRAAPRALHELGGRRMADETLKLDPKRTALLIQDLQNDVITEGGAWADSGAPQHAKEQNVVENVKALADACPQGRRPRDPRLVHRRAGRAGPEAERAALPGREGGEGRRPWHLGRGARRGARAAGGDHVVEKMRMSAWQGTKLETLLDRPRRRHGRRQRAPGRTCRSSTRPGPAPTRAT